jgi:aryl sulfotransferase
MTARQVYRGIMTDGARWDALTFRSGDIVIDPPGKCGTTWMQMLCALLIFDGALDRPLSAISPWLDATTDDLDTVLAVLDAQQHRRFFKTHTPLDGVPFRDDVTYICIGRDPRDASVSFDNHMANFDPGIMAAVEAASGLPPEAFAPPPEDPTARFWMWADQPMIMGGLLGINLEAMLYHVRTFWDRRDEPNVALFHYQDMLADLPGEIRRLAGLLDIEVTDDQVARYAEAATFDRMRARAGELAPHAEHGWWRENQSFFRSGSTGQWTDRLGEADLERYQARLAELAPPEIVSWLHTGWLGSPVSG